MARMGKSLLRGSLLTAGAVLLLLLFSLLHTVFLSPAGSGSGITVVRIEPGSDLGSIGTALHQAGVIDSPRNFLWTARAAGLERKLRSGDYELDPSWNLPRLLEVLSSGRSRMLSVTFPEGTTMEGVAERLSAAGVTDGQAFLALARNRDFLAPLGIPGPTAEGFLFPETYLFASSSEPADVMKVMADQFRTVLAELEVEAPLGKRDLLDTVTLASIVEKETSMPEERPLVAAVFLNRLRKGYRLQSDPTVIYGMENFDGNITRRDLETDTPYNTYLIRGLPPGPIANPGRGALWAVLNPAPVEYLYFVSRNDGSHHFSLTLKEHNRAVRLYQLARRKK